MKKSPIPNFPDVFFEVPEKAHFQYLTTLYGLEPYGVGTGACESLKSYIFRLADAHRVSSKTLLKEGIFNLLITQSNFWKSDRASQLKAVSCYLTPGKITEGLITVLNKATGVDGLASCTMLPMRNLLGTRNMFSSKERHCPLCLDEYKITGRLYGHLSWEIACVTACPIHKIQLVPSTCGASIDQHLKLSSRKNLVGVCSTCGSICYKCKEEESLRASEVAVWKATQVAELISCFPDVSKLFSQKNTIDGLSAIIASYGDGQSAILARKVGLNKSVLWEWVHGNNHPSFGLFLDLCLAVGVSVVSVLKGCPVECLSPLPELISPKQHAQKATDEKRGELLKQALTITPPESLKAIATTLGVDRKMLRIKFPELSRLVVERFRLFISSQITDKDNLTRETVQRVINELTVNGMPLTLRNFQAAIGKALLPESRLRKFFSEYLLFLNDKSLLCLTLISEKLF